MSCSRCGSDRVAGVCAKCSDCCSVSIAKYDDGGYVPGDMGIGGGDYVEFEWCLECGQIQGEWPLEKCEAENYNPKACKECGEADYMNDIGECENCGHKHMLWCPNCDNQAYFTRVGSDKAMCNVGGYRCVVSLEDLKAHNEGE